MNSSFAFRLALLCSILFAMPAPSANAEPYVPPDLAPWVQWVKERNPALSCPLLRESRVCTWPGRISVRANDAGATLLMSAALDTRDAVPLPGGADIWPVECVAEKNGVRQPLVLVERDGRPHAMLEAGRYQLSCRMSWQSLPKTLEVPVTAGIIDLEVNGKQIASPKIDEGELWLQQEEVGEETEEDSISITVSRLLTDAVPFRVTTLLHLRVAGKARELALGNIQLTGTVPVEIQTELSYTVDPSWNLRLQIRPGEYTVRIVSVTAEPPKELRPSAASIEGWPGDEAWAFAADELFRSVELEGATAIDPNRTQLPDEWKGFPTFVLAPSDKLVLRETRRGEQQPLPNSLQLSRKVWLDLDGSGMTVSDSVSGRMNRDWRLNMQPELRLTRASLNGVDQVVTLDPDTKLSGVEIRNQPLELQAVSRVDSPLRTIPAVGWDHDVDSLNVELAMGPGWSLFEVSGPDNNAPTWLSSWRLWDIFFVCLMAIATGKLLGRRAGAAALAALLLCHGQPGAPVYIWLNLLAGKALLENLKPGRLKDMVRVYYVLSFVLLLSVLLPFIIDQIRLGLYPQLTRSFAPGEIFWTALGPTMLLGAVIAFGSSIVLLFKRQYRNAFLVFILSGGVLLLAIVSFSMLSSTSRMQSFQYQGDMDASVSAPAPAPQIHSRSEGAAGGVDADQTELLIEDAPAEHGVMEKLERKPRSPRVPQQTADKTLLQVDPKAVVQTGAGVPHWSWTSMFLTWNGPVQKDRTITLYLISPRINLLLSFLRVLVLIALAAAFANLRALRSSFAGAGVALVLALACLAPVSAHAQSLPGSEMLQELEARLQRDLCTADCTLPTAMRIDVKGEQLTIEAAVSSNGSGAWPIPGPVSQFMPSSVTLDGAPVTEFYRTAEDGLAWIRVPSGAHRVVIQGSIAGRTTVTFQFGIIPRHVEVSAPDWEYDGVSETGSSEETIQLVRRGDSANEIAQGEQTSEEPLLADWYVVTREIVLALPWRITTTVQRLGSSERAAILRVPLLPGESITTDGAKEEGRTAVVTLGRGEASASWDSALPEKAQLELRATTGSSTSEVWKLRCSVMWRCAFEGLAPVRTAEGEEFAAVWQPWPGEALSVSVARPAGVEGATQTIDRVEYSLRPGTGLLQGTLNLDMRVSKGGTRRIQLPENAVLEGVHIDRQPRALALEKGGVTLPLIPGSHNFQITFRQPWEVGFRDTMPSIDLGSDISNAMITVNIPEKRWLLFVCGPKWGPAVLFWGELLAVALFATILGLLRISPLPIWQWVLLGIGMATLHPAFLLLPAASFSLLHYRSRRQFAERWKFNAFQVALMGLCAITIVVMYLSVYYGLIVEPDMGVSGNNSTNMYLKWFVDRSTGSLPQPVVYSVPLWVWRMLMLIWSCWLVFVMLRWMKWGWASLNENGFWRGKIHS